MNATLLSGLLAALLLTLSWMQAADCLWSHSEDPILKSGESFCNCWRVSTGKLTCRKPKRFNNAKIKRCICLKKGKKQRLDRCPLPRPPGPLG